MTRNHRRRFLKAVGIAAAFKAPPNDGPKSPPEAFNGLRPGDTFKLGLKDYTVVGIEGDDAILEGGGRVTPDGVELPRKRFELSGVES